MNEEPTRTIVSRIGSLAAIRDRPGGVAIGSLRLVAAAILLAYALVQADDPTHRAWVLPGSFVVVGSLVAVALVQVRAPTSRGVGWIGLTTDILASSAALFLYADDPSNALYSATFVVLAEGALLLGTTGPLVAWLGTSVGYLGSQVFAEAEFGNAVAPVTSLVRLGSGFGVAVLLRALVQRIRRHERRYRELMEDLDAIVWEADPTSGRITFASGAVERILGYEASRWTERDVWIEWIHPDDLSALNAVRAEVADTGEPRQVEYRAYRRDGRMVWLRDSLSLATRAASPKALRGLTVDVTERRIAEQAARESEERLFRLLETLPVGVFVLEGDGRPYFANRTGRDLLGEDADPGTPVEELAARYNAYVRGTDTPYPSERIPIVRALEGHAGHVDDIEVRRPDRTVPLEVWGAPITDAEGRVIYALAAFADVSDRVSAERSLAEANRRIELLLWSAAEGIYGLDAEGRTTMINPAATAMLGFEPDELIGRSMHDAVHHTRPDGSPFPSEECPVRQAVLDGRGVGGEDVLWRKDGTSFPIEFTVAPIHRDGGIDGAVVTFRDVTERLEVERLKDEFVSMVSHELRTPLTSIRGALGLLATGMVAPTDPRGKEMLDIALGNTDRLVRLINDILDLERMSAGRMPLERTEASARGLVVETVQALEGAAGPAGVTLETDATDARLWVDRDRVIQALVNLVGNAIKFSPRGGTVRVSATETDGEVRFSVRDEGRGIPQDQQARVFDRFAQVDASDAREKGGTGLGLAIARQVVEQHGGRIWVESEPGHGATFHFTLPAVADAEPVERSGRRGVVLVIDDDETVVSFLRALLADHGFRVIGATSGEAALAQIEDTPVDAVVLDLMMPGMSGWEVLERLRERRGDVPVVILSALTSAESDQAPGTPSPVEVFLTKPVSEDALLGAVASAVRPKQGAARALLVEDDHDLADVLTAMLETRSVDVLHAPTASAAVRLAERFPPDVLILDIALPGSDGFSVVEALRARPGLRSVPVVVYSGIEVSEEDRARLRLGTTVFLTKTKVTPEELERRIAVLLERMVDADGTPPAPGGGG